VADLYYIENGYYELGYFVYIADGASQLTSQSSVVCSSEVIRNASSTLEVTVSISAAITHIEGFDLFAFTDAAIAIQVDRLRENNIAVTDVFAINVDYIKVKQSESDLEDTFTSVINGIRNRESTISEFQVAFSFECSPIVIIGEKTEANADLTADFNLSADAGVIINFISNASSVFSITIDSGAVIDNQLTLSSEFSLSATISHIEGADLFAFGNASLTTDVSVIRDYQSAISSNVVLDIQTSKIIEGEVFCDDLFASSASANKTSETISTLTGNFTQSTNARSRLRSGAILSSEFALSLEAYKIIQYQSNVSCEFTSISAISNIRGVDIIASDFANLEVIARATKRGVSALTSQASLSVNFLKIKEFSTRIIYVNDTYVTEDYVEEYSTITSPGALVCSGVIATLIPAQASLVSTTNLSVVGNVTYDIQNNLIGQVAQTTEVNAIFDNTISSLSLFSPLMTINAVRNTFAILDNRIDLVIAGVKTAEVGCDIISNSSVNAQVNKITDIVYELNAYSQINAYVNVIADANASILNEFTLTSAISATRDFETDVAANFEINSDNVRVRFFDSASSVNSVLTADPTLIGFQSINANISTVLDFDLIRIRDNVISTESISISLTLGDAVLENHWVSSL